MAESVDDLVAWLRSLSGGPAITRTVVAQCTRPMHGDDPATWFYVEADASAGVGRMRCLACGDARSVLDSSERWTFPSAWSCINGRASWLVMCVRCVECGHLQGVTDLVVDELDVEELASSL
jgi:ribosomal protein S14